MTWPTRVAGEFEREQTFSEALSVDANGRMVTDRIAVIDPLPGGTTARLDLPTSWTCIYKEAT